MKKILLAVAIVLLGLLSYLVMFKGIKLGNFKINSIAEIKRESENLDKDLNQATEITAQQYPKVKSSLDTSITKLKTTKQQYENKIANLSDADVLKYQQIDKYEKEFLWTKIGTYATKQNLDLEINIVDIASKDYFDLDFSVVGTYSGVADFIYAIENDDELGFRIEDFSAIPYSVTETTKILSGDGKVTNKDVDYAYSESLQKEFSGSIGKTTSKTKQSLPSGNTITSTNTVEKTATTDNQTTSKTSTSSQTGNATTVMNNPDRVYASFKVKKVSVNLK